MILLNFHGQVTSIVADRLEVIPNLLSKWYDNYIFYLCACIICLECFFDFDETVVCNTEQLLHQGFRCHKLLINLIIRTMKFFEILFNAQTDILYVQVIHVKSKTTNISDLEDNSKQKFRYQIVKSKAEHINLMDNNCYVSDLIQTFSKV